MDTLNGRVWSVTFSSGDFNIFQVESSGRRFTCKGTLFGIQSLSAGLALEMTGRWVHHQKFGRQFEVAGWSPWAASDGDVEVFLRSCLGVAVLRAGEIADAFGVDTFKVLTETPQLLDQIEGMDEVAKYTLLTAWGLVRTSSELATFLSDHDVTSAQVRGVLVKFGIDAIKELQKDPYRLVELDEFTFTKADSIARRLGVSENDPRRYEGAVLWVLRDAMSSGHLCVRRGDISPTLQNLARTSTIDAFDDMNLTTEIAKAVIRLQEAGRLVIDSNVGVYLPQNYYYERESARLLGEFMGASTFETDPEEFVNSYETMFQIGLSSMQKDAITKLVKHKVLVLTGLPGTGKTTVVKAIVNLFERQGLSFVLMAPTGIAAKRLAAVTSRMASTIHRAFRYDGEGNWGFNRGNKYPINAVVVDEVSMVDQELFFRILDALNSDTVLVLVGDDAQLPSVGPGNVLRELIRCADVPTVRLTEIFRQSQQSAIVTNSHAINKGEDIDPGDDSSDFRFISIANEAKAADLITQMSVRLKARDANFQVLSPKYDGTLGVNNLNNLLREALNPPEEGKREATVDGCKFRDGDRLMIIKNDYDLGVYNGDMGKLMSIERDHFVVRIHNAGDGNLDLIVEVPRSDVPTKLKLAYAITVHKCVEPSTLVETPRGLIPFEHLQGDDTRLATPFGNASFFNMVKNDVGPMLEVETEDGYVLRVTPDHGLDVWGDQGYVRKEARDIVSGEFVRLRLGAEFPEAPAGPLPPPPDAYDCRAQVHDVPRTLNDDLAEFLGLFVADGTLYQKGFRFVKRHKECADRFAELCRLLFRIEPKIGVVDNAYKAEVNSTYLATWLRGIDGLSPHLKAIPRSILASGVHTQAAFLRGLFEDGSVHLKGEVLDHIELVSHFSGLAEQTKVLLLRQGIISGLLHRKDGNLSVYIYGVNAKRFSDQIGLVSKTKSDRLKARVGEETRYLVPVLPSEVLAVASANGGRSGFLTCTEKNAFNRKTMSRHTLQGLLDRSTVHPPEWQVLSDRLGFHHSRVRSINPYSGPSMCVEVPDGNQFLQNGFAGWNCQGSEFETILLPMVRHHGRMLQRNLFYTAVTRARKKVWVLGDRGAITRAIANDQVVQRGTAFARAITAALPSGVEDGDQEGPHGTDRDRGNLRGDPAAPN